MSEATLEGRVKFLEERVSKLEKIEKFLDEQERRQRADIDKQNESLVRSQEIEKRMRGLKELSKSKMGELEQTLLEQEKQSGKNIARRELYLLYFFSANDATSDALRKLFKDKRDWIEKNYCPFFVETQHALKEKLFSLFDEPGVLPITPSALLVERNGTVQTCFIGYGEVGEFLTKGGAT